MVFRAAHLGSQHCRAERPASSPSRKRTKNNSSPSQSFSPGQQTKLKSIESNPFPAGTIGRHSVHLIEQKLRHTIKRYIAESPRNSYTIALSVYLSVLALPPNILHNSETPLRTHIPQQSILDSTGRNLRHSLGSPMAALPFS